MNFASNDSWLTITPTLDFMVVIRYFERHDISEVLLLNRSLTNIKQSTAT
jgi:hypothetical protein